MKDIIIVFLYMLMPITCFIGATILAYRLGMAVVCRAIDWGKF